MATLCPSAPCQEGAILLGIVMPDGRVAYASNRPHVDADFVAAATGDGQRTPERRFRFSSPCMAGGCRQWTGQRCGVIDRVLEAAAAPEAPARIDVDARDTAAGELPACGIRDECRWFHQAGPEACAVCDLVITDSR